MIRGTYGNGLTLSLKVFIYSLLSRFLHSNVFNKNIETKMPQYITALRLYFDY